jgi:hypothetical protein
MTLFSHSPNAAPGFFSHEKPVFQEEQRVGQFSDLLGRGSQNEKNIQFFGIFWTRDYPLGLFV